MNFVNIAKKNNMRNKVWPVNVVMRHFKCLIILNSVLELQYNIVKNVKIINVIQHLKRSVIIVEKEYVYKQLKILSLINRN